jgi:hypothetical protein
VLRDTLRLSWERTIALRGCPLVCVTHKNLVSDDLLEIIKARKLASGTFHPYGTDSSFGKKTRYQRHTLVKARDYIFTSYPLR